MRKKNIFKMDFLSVSFLVIAITLVIVGVTDFISLSRFAETSAGNEAKGIAISVANNIDGDKFKKIIETGKSNLYYEEVRVKLNKTLNDVGLKYLSTITVNGDKFNYIVDGSEPNSDDFSDYMSEESLKNTMLKEFFDKKIVGYSEMYKDETWGYLLSAVAPIKDSKGEIVAWVEADMSVNDIKQSINIFILRLALVLFFALVVLFIMRKFCFKLTTILLNTSLASCVKVSHGFFITHL